LVKIEDPKSKEEIIDYIKRLDEKIREKKGKGCDGWIYLRKKLNNKLREMQRDES